MNAALYDPADVAFLPSDRAQQEPPEAAPTARQQQPDTRQSSQPDQRVQIGPQDV